MSSEQFRVRFILFGNFLFIAIIYVECYNFVKGEFMINILSDGSVFIGDIINGQKQGKGEYYFLADVFVAYKVAGEWNDNKLNGVATIFTTDYEEIGQYEIGVKNGDFFRYYYNGVHIKMVFVQKKKLFHARAIDTHS